MHINRLQLGKPLVELVYTKLGYTVQTCKITSSKQEIGRRERMEVQSYSEEQHLSMVSPKYNIRGSSKEQ